MGKKSGARDRRPPRPKKLPSAVKWILGLAVLGGLGYGVTEMSGVPYDDKAIAVVDFSGLTPSQKREALQAANRSRCTCGCGMNAAQCVATDSTCPLRDDNIKKIRSMVREAAQKG
ncbi:MAG: hypothetical protein AB7N65_06060 [Vicinamibacterales bacterium]